MASRLEKSTVTAKKIGIGCGVLILIILLYNIGASIFRKEPDPYDPYPQYAEKKYNDIQKLEFESLQLADESEPNFKIETTDGSLPKIRSIMNVYKTKTPRQSLTAQDDAVDIAKSLGFNETPLNITETELKWTKEAKTLIIDKLYGDVSLTTDYTKDPDAKNDREILPDSEPYVQTAKNFLKKAHIFPSNYQDSDKNTVTYLKLNSNNVFEKAKSAQDANFVRVDFFQSVESVGVTIPEGISEEQQATIDDYRLFADVITDNPYEGLIYIILANESGVDNIYELKYVDWELESKSTYDLIGISNAWEEVKKENGYLKSLFEMNTNPFQEYTPLDIKSFLLTNVEISYYSSREYLKYIQPMYKFTGIAKLEDDNGNDIDYDFTYYYPAIELEKSIETEENVTNE